MGKFCVVVSSSDAMVPLRVFLGGVMRGGKTSKPAVVNGISQTFTLTKDLQSLKKPFARSRIALGQLLIRPGNATGNIGSLYRNSWPQLTSTTQSNSPKQIPSFLL